MRDPRRRRHPARAAEVAVREVPFRLDDRLRGERGALRAEPRRSEYGLQ